MMHTYNHGDVLLPLLQEIPQELCCAAQGQVLKCIGDPVPQLQHVQPVPQPGQMHHLSVAESAEGTVNQICRGKEGKLYSENSILSPSSRASQVVLVVRNLPARAGDARNVGSILGLGRSPGEGNGNPLQYSCLKNHMDRGGWWATVHGVTKSLTRLSTHTHIHTHTHTHTHTLPSSKFILSLFTLLNLNFLSCYQIKRPEIFIVKDIVHEYNCIILGGKVWKNMNRTIHGFLTVILPDSRIDAVRLSFFTL